MTNWDWDRLGKDINKTVQDAIDSRNYNKLNQTINNTINQAVSQAINGIGKGLHEAGDAVNRGIHGMGQQDGQAGDAYQGHPYEEDQRGQDHPYQGYSYQNRERNRNRQQGGYQKRYQSGTRSGQTAVQSAYYCQNPALYKKTGGVKAGGTALAAVGYVIGGGLILGLAILLAGSFAVGTFGAIFRVLFATGSIFFALSAILAGAGTVMLGRVKRFRAYIQGLNGKEYAQIKELAQKLRKAPKFVARDLEKMIQKGWFKQGHLDSQRTCLMVSHKAYDQYTELMQHIETQKQQEQEKKEKQEEQKSAYGNVDPQVAEIIKTGDAYIKKIHECNDAIPGEEISAKISHMETLVDRIFDRVEQKPECAAEIRKLMEYYLPTTVKLLGAYEELDAQPVQGENILSSKKEIEATLDTLNVAFEKLLDSLFQETAWDVSSDISVLKTMLAQEGLTKNDF